eukprot:GILJ01003748.1.p1 GENE.GILJ01003748.1~~GILJ01003748.1.p1  ORF type:complete len:325 (+),score=27.72 GILJ01003748.1:44-976(+)
MQLRRPKLHSFRRQALLEAKALEQENRLQHQHEVQMAYQELDRFDHLLGLRMKQDTHDSQISRTLYSDSSQASIVGVNTPKIHEALEFYEFTLRGDKDRTQPGAVNLNTVRPSSATSPFANQSFSAMTLKSGATVRIPTFRSDTSFSILEPIFIAPRSFETRPQSAPQVRCGQTTPKEGTQRSTSKWSPASRPQSSCTVVTAAMRAAADVELNQRRQRQQYEESRRLRLTAERDKLRSTLDARRRVHLEASLRRGEFHTITRQRQQRAEAMQQRTGTLSHTDMTNVLEDIDNFEMSLLLQNEQSSLNNVC